MTGLFYMNIKNIIIKQLQGLLHLVYPPICLSCQRIIDTQTMVGNICKLCLDKLKPIPPNYVSDHILNRLIPPYLDDIQIFFQFDEIMQTIIHHVKYQQMNNCAIQIAQYASHSYDSLIERNKLIIPVPLHPLREKERGYNQSYYIAKGFFDNDIDYINHKILVRVRSTKTQTELNREERQQNVQDAFKVNSIEPIKDKLVVLVDDVVTTGATMNECAKILLDAGAKKVVGYALATPVE
jgi:competence protein ComFC